MHVYCLLHRLVMRKITRRVVESKTKGDNPGPRVNNWAHGAQKAGDGWCFAAGHLPPNGTVSY